MSASPYRIGLVDDQRLFRKGLRMIIDDCPNCTVIFEAKDGLQFFQRLAFEPLDLILLDIEMPELDGVETLRRIRQEYPDLRVIMLTMHNSNRLIVELMEIGANGFLIKDEDPEVVCQAIGEVMTKGVFFRDYVSNALLQRQRVAGQGSDYARQLSDRELEVLYLLCKEFNSQEIADRLFISKRTVEGHRRNIQQKLGVRNLAGMVLWAVERGVV